MFRKSNARLLAISPQLPEHSRNVITKHRLGFEILYDQDNHFARKLDLVHGFSEELKTIYRGFGIDLDQANGNQRWELAMPTRIVVDQQHSIKSIEVNASYTQRPEPEDTLNVVMS